MIVAIQGAVWLTPGKFAEWKKIRYIKDLSDMPTGWRNDRQEELDMTDDSAKKVDGAAEVPMYFRGTYEEAFDLLVEARNYVENDVAAFKYAENPPDPLAMTQETMRLTSRLTQVMAWLMAQRAVHEGEIDEEEFIKDKYRLEGHAVCLKCAIDDMEGDLPDGLNDLMERSYSLYRRIMRLDEQIVGDRKEN
jgi:regulator of CtrA degradation